MWQPVPGRKTDVRDCKWLAQLPECGMLKGSFVPAPEIPSGWSPPAS